MTIAAPLGYSDRVHEGPRSSKPPLRDAERPISLPPKLGGEDMTASVGTERARSLAPKPLLMVISGPSLGSQLELGEAVVDIGRHGSCGLVIASSSVSRRHARVEPAANGYLLRDLGSKNGTTVRGRRIIVHDLADGDVFEVGKAAIKYAALGNPEAGYYRKLVAISATDSLTGASNRRYFDEALSLHLVRTTTSKQPLSLILFDLDHFKNINDELGHTAGDEVLRQVTQTVRGQVRASDILARVGGEEFAVICIGADPGAAARLAERIRAAVASQQIRIADRLLSVTISLGVSTVKQRTGSVADLYKAADGALYESKRSGRNRVTISD